jgi:hypothetical protein
MLLPKKCINEQDGDSNYPDCNIGFDTFRYFPPFRAVPEPITILLVVFGLAGLA